jgi:predicted ArsR family transcriptional regulator
MSNETAPSDQGGRQFPVLDDVIDMTIDTSDDDERMYLVLFEEDYDDLILDAEDSVALLVDNDQAVEILKIASNIVAELAPTQAPDKEPIQAMIDDLKEVRDAE